MNRYFSSFSIAIVIYISIISVYLYANKPITAIKTQQTKSDQIVKFTIIQEVVPIVKEVIKEPLKPIEKKELIVKKPEILPTKKIKPIEKKVVVRKVEPNKNKPKEKPKKHKEIVKKPEIKKEKLKEKMKTKTDYLVEKKLIKSHKSLVKKETNSVDDLKNKKIDQERYYSQIKKIINKNKSYPKVAIRRGIEGEVKIKFCISTKGELLSYEIIKGKKVFHKSIVKAIEQSFPIIPPKDILSKNLDLALTVQYKLY